MTNQLVVRRKKKEASFLFRLASPAWLNELGLGSLMLVRMRWLETCRQVTCWLPTLAQLIRAPVLWVQNLSGFADCAKSGCLLFEVTTLSARCQEQVSGHEVHL